MYRDNGNNFEAMLSDDKFYTDDDFKHLTSETLKDYLFSNLTISFKKFGLNPLVQEILTPEELESPISIIDLLREFEGLY